MHKKILTIFLIFLIPLALYPQSGGNALYLQNENYLNHGDFVYFGSRDYNFSDKITVSAWVKWTTNPQNYVNVHNEQEGRKANIVTMDRHNGKDDGQFWLQHSTNNNKFEFAVQTTSTNRYVTSTTTPAENVWVHLTGVYDATASSDKLSLYVNGVMEGSTNSISGNIASYNGLLRLVAGRLPSGYRLFAGIVDEIRIWKRALSQDEIRQQMFHKNTINTSELVSYWDMNSSSGTAVTDKSGQNVNGVFYTALADVHSYTTSPYFTITDDDKDWEIDTWTNCIIKTVGGDGVDETNVATSNSETVLVFQNPWITTPKLDDQGAGTGMTWFGIEKSGETSQWIKSTASVGEDSKHIKTIDSNAIGQSSASLSVTIKSVPGNTNNLTIYYWGSYDGPPVTNEIFPPNINRRSNIVWGVNEWGDVTANIFISYGSIQGIINPAGISLLGRVRGSNTWIIITPSMHNSVNRTFWINNATDFYEYSLGAQNDPMPVNLEYFIHSSTKNSVLLKWATSAENNNSGFMIERMTGRDWEPIGFVKGTGTTNQRQTYEYNDRNLKTGIYKYRLKQTDYNGNYEYFYLNSDVLITPPNDFTLFQNYPNPANPNTNISYNLPAECSVSLEIYDVSGRMISVLVNERQLSGYYNIKFDGSNYSSGVYFYRISAKSEEQEYIKTNKLFIIK